MPIWAIHLLLLIIALFQRRNSTSQEAVSPFEPHVTLFIPAYNEAGSIEAKMKNSHACWITRKKNSSIVWVTDGSDDDSSCHASAI